MANEPKTIREANFVVQGIVDRLDLVQKMTWAVIGLLGSLIAGAAALYFQLSEIKAELAVIKEQQATQANLVLMENKFAAAFARIEGKLALGQVPDGLAVASAAPGTRPPRSAVSVATGSVAAVPTTAAPALASASASATSPSRSDVGFADASPRAGPPSLTTAEVQLLRRVLKPTKTGKRQEAVVGNSVPRNIELHALPPTITDRIPQLEGYRYGFDNSGSLLIVSMPAERVFQIIGAI